MGHPTAATSDRAPRSTRRRDRGPAPRAGPFPRRTLDLLLLTLGILGFGLGCADSTSVPVPGDARASVEPSPSGSADASAPVAASNRPLFLTSSVRCGECHVKIAAEWAGSNHARTNQSAAYIAMRARAEAAVCDRCHNPLQGFVKESDPIAQEGVTCLICHTVSDVELKRSGAGFGLHLDDNIMYGPLCDAKNNYFHKVECSPLHQTSELCAGCHNWYMARPSGGELPIITDFEEWKKRSAELKEKQCQDCHMQQEAAQIAVGWDNRLQIAHHGMWGVLGNLREKALALTLSLSGDAKRLHLVGVLKNVGAGHRAPAGLPGRQILFRARVIDRAGRETAREERAYGRVLVDDGGTEVPFTQAVRVASDNRLEPSEARAESFSFEAPPGPGEIRVDVLWRPFTPSILERLSLPPRSDVPMLQAKIPFGPPNDKGERAMLPAKISVKR